MHYLLAIPLEKAIANCCLFITVKVERKLQATRYQL